MVNKQVVRGLGDEEVIKSVVRHNLETQVNEEVYACVDALSGRLKGMLGEAFPEDLLAKVLQAYAGDEGQRRRIHLDEIYIGPMKGLRVLGSLGWSEEKKQKKFEEGYPLVQPIEVKEGRAVVFCRIWRGPLDATGWAYHLRKEGTGEERVPQLLPRELTDSLDPNYVHPERHGPAWEMESISVVMRS